MEDFTDKRMQRRLAMLEAALFMANDPVSPVELAKLLKAESGEMPELINAFKSNLASFERGIILIETAEGYQLRVKPEYVKCVRHLTPFQDLSRGLLRVLALVAYKQPMSQSDIVKVIGNRTYEYVKILVQKGLLKSDKVGRTRALFVTKGFADYFGLENPEDARKLLDEMNIGKIEKKIEQDEENLKSGKELAEEDEDDDDNKIGVPPKREEKNEKIELSDTTASNL